MRIVAFVGASSLVLGLVFACGSEESTRSSSPHASIDVASADVTKDGAVPAPDGFGYCCAPDEAPGCCMAYGGWSAAGSCATLCDGMPVPSTPGWAIVDDAHGCKVWRQPSGGARCGQAILPDAGHDADASDASDAGGD